MTLLSEIIQLKQQERENELKDINAIGSAVENFVKIRAQNEARTRQASIDELSRRNIESQISEREKIDPFADIKRRNIESQIEARKPSALEEIAERASLITDLQAGAKAGDLQSLNMLKELIGQGKKDSRDFLDPIVAKDTAALDEIMPPEPLVGTDVDNLLDKDGLALRRTAQQTDILGELTPEAEQAKSQLGLQEQKAKAVITGEAAVDLQELKKGAEIRRNMSSGDLKLDITLTEFFKFAKEQQDLLGLPAGPLAGSITKIVSAMSAENKNKFLASFEGSRIELAAFVGRNAMPGTRAARIIELFKKTTPSPFDTIGSGIRNAAVSWGQAITTDFGPNTNEYIPGYSDMSISEQDTARRDILKPYVAEQINLFEDNYTIAAYKVSPEMFTEKDRANAEKLVRESVRLNLRSK